MASSLKENGKQNKLMTQGSSDEEEALLGKNSARLKEGIFKQN